MKKPNPFPYTDSNKRYHTYDYDMRMRYGGKCVKIPLDGGFTCPNIDGSKGRGGCTYCTKEGLSLRGRPIAEQYAAGIAKLMPKWGRHLEDKPRFIPYFQTFTGTYGQIERLKLLYEEAMALDGAVGLAIATRADCITQEVADLLHEVANRIDLTVELGLQTVHEQTARAINRGHTFEEFLEGYYRLDGIRRCVHLIDGLPGEDREMMLGSARVMAQMNPEMIKFHFLYIAKGTPMADAYQRGEVRELALDEYVDLLISQLELLPPTTVIGRVTGDGQADELIAPLWSRKKFVVMNEIDKEMAKRDTYQGRLFNIDKKCQ